MMRIDSKEQLIEVLVHEQGMPMLEAIKLVEGMMKEPGFSFPMMIGIKHHTINLPMDLSLFPPGFPFNFEPEDSDFQIEEPVADPVQAAVQEAYKHLHPEDFELFAKLAKKITDTVSAKTPEDNLFDGIDAALSLVKGLHAQLHPSKHCPTIHELVDVLLKVRSDLKKYTDKES